MNAREIKKIAEQYAKLLNYNRKIHVRLKPYKTKAASANLSKSIITINKHLANAEEEITKYLVLHELIHLKLGTTTHNRAFNKVLRNFFNKEDIERIRDKIINTLLQLNRLKQQNKTKVD